MKSSTSVKAEHLTDVAIQAHVLRKSGESVERASVMHLNNRATAPRLENLFLQVDVTHKIEPIEAELPTKIAQLREALEKTEPPAIDIGPHCSAPHECPFQEHCWKHVPSPSIFDLPGMGTKAWNYYAKNIVSLSDDRLVLETERQTRRLEAARTGVRWVDTEAISHAMASWKWPLYYLDFETIGFAIPRYEGTRPYEQVPFQFSCLIQEEPQGLVTEERSYLHEKGTDPRAELAKALVTALQGRGNIVAYNMSFEAECLEALADYSPGFAEALRAAKARLVDPLPIFRSAVYDRAFQGSFSIKKVAPALLGEASSYEKMLVGDGAAAQRAFLRLIDPATPHEERKALRQAMLDYCRKDTVEMLGLVDWLVNQGVARGRRTEAAR